MMSFFMWNQIVLGEKNSILLLKNLTGNKFLHIFSLEVSPRCIHIICGCKYIGSIHQLDVNIETWCNNPLILAMLLMFWGHSLNKNRKWICYVSVHRNHNLFKIGCLLYLFFLDTIFFRDTTSNDILYGVISGFIFPTNQSVMSRNQVLMY